MDTEERKEEEKSGELSRNSYMIRQATARTLVDDGVSFVGGENDAEANNTNNSESDTTSRKRNTTTMFKHPFEANLFIGDNNHENDNNRKILNFPILIIVVCFVSTILTGAIIGFQWGTKKSSPIIQETEQQLLLDEGINQSFESIMEHDKNKNKVSSSTTSSSGGNNYDYFDYNIDSRWISLGRQLVGTYDCSGFGEAIDFNGDGTILALGANKVHESTGSVKVMKYSSTSGGSNNWSIMGDIIGGHYKGESFGKSLQLSKDGNILVVGGYGNGGDNYYYGQVSSYNYVKSTNEWIPFGKYIQGDYQGDRFGISLSMSDNGLTWIAGADNNININVESRQDDNNNIKRRDGYAKVYSMNHNGEWVQRGRTILGSNGSWTGYAVAMSGDGQTICVSDRFYSVRKGFQPGRVRCFKWWHTDWRKLGGDLLGDYHRENIGYSLSLNGDGTVVAIGAPRYGSGSVRVYSLQGDGCWKIRGDKLVGSKVDDQIGYKVKLNKKGNVLAYTGLACDYLTNDNTGLVKVRRWNGEGEWLPLGDTIIGHKANDFFGESLALNDAGTNVASSSNRRAGCNNDNDEYVNAFTLA